MKIIWMSDLHFEPSPQLSSGVDPTERIKLVIDEVNTLHSDAAYCVVSGDLIDSGDAAHYSGLKLLLDKLTVPLLPVVGNHDNRAALIAMFGAMADADSPFLHYAIDAPNAQLIFLDTQVEGESYGELCAERYDWLEKTLTNAGTIPSYIFMHHPPAKLGLGVLDDICLADHEKFIKFLGRFQNVMHLFAGHVHRPVSASIAGIPLTIMPSIRTQAPLPYPAWDWDEFVPTSEAPMYGIVQIDGRDSVVQYKQF